MSLPGKHAQCRFYGPLNDFLAPELRGVSFEHRFEIAGSVKDMIEALGVPHTEVELILVNGVSVDFTCRVRDGDRVSVYPAFGAIDITPISKITAPAAAEPKFVADTHLGRLAASLRMLGFDTLYRNDYRDDELVEASNAEERTLLTRDLGILKRSAVKRGYFVRSTRPRQQLIEVTGRFHLAEAATPFQRCIRCNARLRPTAKEMVAEQLPPKVRDSYAEFRVCPNCGRVYWKGTHYSRMRQRVEQLMAAG